MRPDDILNAMSDISDRHIEQARPKRRRARYLAAALAAVLVIAVALPSVLPRMGGGADSESGIADLEESAPESSIQFMSYAGPIMPLTSTAEGLSAGRTVTLDFSPWEPVWHDIDSMLAELPESERENARAEYEELYPDGGYWSESTDIIVRDSYVLSGAEGHTVLVYPFISSFSELAGDMPSLTLDGRPLYGALYAGDLAGYYAGDTGGGFDYGSGIDSWDSLSAVLASGGYMAAALENDMSFAETPVTVYRVEDISAPPESEEAQNPTLELSFTVDADSTTVWSWGFNGGSWDFETGEMSRNFSTSHDRDGGHCLIVIGGDISEPDVTGYRTGDCSEGNELAGVTASVTREETTMGEILREAFDSYMENYFGVEYGGADGFDRELLYSVSLRTLALYYETGAEIYEDVGSLFGAIAAYDRVFYLVCDVDLSAGGVFTAELVKEASFDYQCAHTENQGLSGYELAADLGSNIDMLSLTARLENFENCTISGGNFGFDPENGVFETELDPSVDLYHLEVRRK